MKYVKLLCVGLMLVNIALYVSAVGVSSIHYVPCIFIKGIWGALTNIVLALIVLMLLYGAAKYAAGADDPGARKQAKNIIIHVIIGVIILSLIAGLFTISGVSNYICGISLGGSPPSGP